jgi:DNA-binding response OmpR family regulator
MGSTTLPSKLIAVVEDDRELATLFQAALEEFGLWRVVLLHDGAEAFQHLPTLRADLIVLDVGLPNLDGISLYRMLQGHRATSQTPILIVTASYEWQLRRQGLEPDTIAVLRKPFDMDNLLERVKRLLTSQGETTSAVLS